MIRISSLVAVVAAASTLAAQNTQVLPAGYGLESSYGTSVFTACLGAQRIGDSFTYYSTAGVGLPHGAKIVEVAMRPSAPDRLVLDARSASIRVAFGYPAPGVVGERLPVDPDAIVDGGVRAMTTVATQNVSLPAFDMRTSPRSFSVKIATTPFVYDANRGGLVVRLQGSLVSTDPNAYYSVDAFRQESDAVAAKQRHLLSACSAGGVASSDPKSLVPGGVGSLYLTGATRDQVLVFAGTERGARFPIDLGPVGMPECSLWTSPLILLPSRTAPTRRGRFARVYLPIPASDALRGVAFRVQGLELDLFANAAGIRLFGGVEIEIGGRGARSYRAATVARLFDGYFDLADSYEYGPVLQLSY